jgi:lactoylglutathione lyase
LNQTENFARFDNPDNFLFNSHRFIFQLTIINPKHRMRNHFQFLATFIFLFVVYPAFSQNSQSSKIQPVINHVSLFVNDLEKSASFYEKIVLLKRIEDPFKDGKHTWLSIGGNRELHISPGAPANVTHPKSLHLAFSVASLEAFIEHLEKNKIDYVNWPGDSKKPNTRPDGVRQIYFQDPDGYWIEINNDVN